MKDIKSHDSIRSVLWRGDRLRLLDQRKLPFAEDYIDCMNSAEVAQAIVWLLSADASHPTMSLLEVSGGR